MLGTWDMAPEHRCAALVWSHHQGVGQPVTSSPPPSPSATPLPPWVLQKPGVAFTLLSLSLPPPQWGAQGGGGLREEPGGLGGMGECREECKGEPKEGHRVEFREECTGEPKGDSREEPKEKHREEPRWEECRGGAQGECRGEQAVLTVQVLCTPLRGLSNKRSPPRRPVLSFIPGCALPVHTHRDCLKGPNSAPAGAQHPVLGAFLAQPGVRPGPCCRVASVMLGGGSSLLLGPRGPGP